MASLPRIEVHIWSDVACPWCWVGVKRYQKAVGRLADRADIHTKFHPYMIDPATNKDGEEYLAYNQRRWGSDGWTHSLRRSGKPDGATFSDWQWWPNTVKAHQLIQIADEQDQGYETKVALFSTTYEQGGNISSSKTLLELAGGLGLAGVDDRLDSQQYQQSVIAEDRRAKQELNIHGVPHFVIGSGEHAVALHGAQSVNALAQALERQIRTDQ